jgi:hypothetical protein
MNDKQKASRPFSGYHVTLVPGSTLPEFGECSIEHPLLAALKAGRPVVLSLRDATTLYEQAEADSGKQVSEGSIAFTPIRCNRPRALPFESVALNAIEILCIVHEGFFGTRRCREAAIAAVQTCGALPVPSIGLGPVKRRAQRSVAEHHVDTLIDREADIHIHPAGRQCPGAQA